MTTILISSDDQAVGEDVAKRAAEAVGFKYLGPELLEQAATKYDTTARKLREALQVGRRRKGNDLLLARIQIAVLDALQEDDLVCAGLAAHLYVKNISHVLTLRILTDMEERVKQLVSEQGLSERRARKQLDRERANRSRWSEETFGVDECDAANYDLVIRMTQIELDKIIQIIRDTATYSGFQAMTYSRKCLADLLLAARVREKILPEYPEVRVSANGDRAIVHVKCSKRRKQQTVVGIKELAGQLPGVGLVEVHTVSSLREPDEERQKGPFLNDE